MKIKNILLVAGAVMFSAISSDAVVIRTVGGEWFDDAANWSTGSFPQVSDGVTRVETPDNSTSITLSLSSASATIDTLTLGLGEGATTQTLVVQTNLTAQTAVNVAISGSQLTYSTLTVDGGVALSPSFYLGTTGSGAASSGTVSVVNGGVIDASTQFYMRERSSATVGTDSSILTGSLVMDSGALLYLEGTAEVVFGGNLLSDEDLNSYIDNNWIYGDGVAGDVQLSYNSLDDETVLSVIPEPATIGLFGLSAVVAMVIRRLRMCE